MFSLCPERVKQLSSRDEANRNREIRVMKRIGLASLAALCCCIHAPRGNAEPLVFIVSYHNVDYAKTVCDYILAMEKGGWGEVTKDSPAGAAECKSVRD